jgi:hypothetical protein
MKTETLNRTREATLPLVSLPELLDPSCFFCGRVLMGTTVKELLRQGGGFTAGRTRKFALAVNRY